MFCKNTIIKSLFILNFAVNTGPVLWAMEKKQDEFRIYDSTTPVHVQNFYKLNHTYQTLEFVKKQKEKYLPLKHARMSIWQAIQLVDSLVDESDPDTNLKQSNHFFQTAESARIKTTDHAYILAAFIHDLGKVLTSFGEPQWAVVGDTFPVGCAFSAKIVFSNFFTENPDFTVAEYKTPLGIYSYNIGLENVHMSWGHDEYLYHVIKNYLPPEISYLIRYHSFYAAHREKEYGYLMNDFDRKMMPKVEQFSSLDLYSKDDDHPVNQDQLMPFYESLVSEFFPAELDW